MEQCKAYSCAFRLRKDGEKITILCVRVVNGILVEGGFDVPSYASLLQKFRTALGGLSGYLEYALERDKVECYVNVTTSVHRICCKQGWSRYSTWAPGIPMRRSWSYEGRAAGL